MEKKIFSISKKNKEVSRILKSLNKNEISDYICQAIIEKDKRDREIPLQNDLKASIKEILEDLLKEKDITPSKPIIKEEPKPIINKSENENLIMSMMDSWDD